MEKLILTIAVLFCIIANIIALNSTDAGFVIGDYSSVQSDFALRALQDAYFNVKRSAIFPTTNIPEVLSLYDSYGLDVRPVDYLWDAENDNYGIYYPSYSNAYTFEIEYTDIDPGGDDTEKWFYKVVSKDGVGPTFSTDSETIDQITYNVLKCSESPSGSGVNPAMAVDKFVQRPGMHNPDEPIYAMFKYHSNITESYTFKWKMRLSDNNYLESDEICKLGIKVLVYNTTTRDYHYRNIYYDNLFDSNENTLYNSTTLTKGMFIANSATDLYNEFSFTININSLIAHLSNYNETLVYSWGNSNQNCKWKYLMPIVEYKDRGTLYIDNITALDNIHNSLVNDPNEIIKNSIHNRISYYEAQDTHDNIYAFDTLDEPTPPQFNSYKLIEDEIDTSVEDHRLVTAINAYGWDGWGQSGGSQENSFYNAKLFDSLADPEVISPDYYLYNNETWKWNDVTAPLNIQRNINRVTGYYRKVVDNVGFDKPFIPIVQTWGNWDFTDNEWNTIMLPTNEQQKMLLYLPLCYGADGIFTFVMARDVDISGARVENESYYYSFPGSYNTVDIDEELERGRTSIIGCINRDGTEWIEMPQYNAVQEANHKLSFLGPIIEDLNWETAGTVEGLCTELEYSPHNSDLNSIIVNDIGDNFYDGYIECGEYSDTQSNPYYLLVNRRTNFTKVDGSHNDGDQYTCFDVNSYFDIADAQTVTFDFSNLGDNYKLIDQYSDNIYDLNEAILIQPGECLLLKLDQLPIPEIISEDITISNKYIPYSIAIQSGNNVTLGDNVTFGPEAEITVSSGATLVINSDTRFGSYSKIKVYGTLDVNGATLTASTDSWNGIIAYNGSNATIQNYSTIENADIGIRAENCDVQIINSTIKDCKTGIDIRDHDSICNLTFDSSNIILSEPTSIGIKVLNEYENNNIQITGTDSSPSSFISNNNQGNGIEILTYSQSATSVFNCEYTNFSGLDIGILHEPFRSTTHQITNCNFNNCNKGIQVIGNGRLFKIENNEFYNNDIGLSINTAITSVLDNNFDGNYIGLDLENTNSYRNTSEDFVIDGNNFGYNSNANPFGIQIFNSSPRIENSILKCTFGITNNNYSNANLSYNANNVFDCTYAHLHFTNSSTIQLGKGHNDFHQSDDNYLDMLFNSNYSNESEIDANYNWWQDMFTSGDRSMVDHSGPAPVIIHEFNDSSPNVTYFPDPSNRYETAINEELSGNYQISLNMFKVILSEYEEFESKIWHNCIDKIFKLSLSLGNDITELKSYYENCYNSIPSYLTSDQVKSLQILLENYIKKCYLINKEYQPAAEIVVERINNPISEVDSLFAVMELETIYTLSEKDSLGRSAKVNTRFNHLAPKSTSDFNDKQKKHWSELYRLIGMNDDDDENFEQTIPVIPTLYNNYPNPFNPETTISFSIPENSDTKVSIYNVKGQKVKDLLDEHLEKGQHNVVWQSKDNSGKSVASGVYFYQLEVNGKTQGINKCLLLK